MRAVASSVVRLNRLSRSMLMALQRDELAVQMRLAAPNTEALPATCSLTMSRSTAMPACARELSGAYKVQPVAAPPST